MNQVKTKRIKSNKEKNIRKFDILYTILYFIIFELITKDGIVIISTTLSIYDGNIIHFIIVCITFFSFYFLVTLAHGGYIYIAIILAFRSLYVKKLKENSKYKVIDNIEYYRDRFNDITPAEISLITDLEIETKKDISASILSLYQKGFIRFEDDRILVNELDSHNLRTSEKTLISMIRENDFTINRINTWENECGAEAKADNYIREKDKKQRKITFSTNNKIIKISWRMILASLIIIGLYYMPESIEFYKTNNFEVIDNKMDVMDSYSEKIDKIYYNYYDEYNYKFDIELLKNNPEYKQLYVDSIIYMSPVVLASLLFLISIFTLIGSFIYRRFKRRIYKAGDNPYERTDEGNILVEQIAGIKNYIHDFSLLSEKEKECIVLWEDFLIYAIVLEENEKIVDDVFKYKNINLDILSNLKSIINT